MSPVSSSAPSTPLSTSSMLSDPFIYRLSQMCLKDPVVQSLYTGRVSWADIPSDDDDLELDDWESYNKMHEYAKTSYQRVYSARQRRENTRFTIKNQSRTPYLTLKQNRFAALCCNSPVEVVEEPIITPPILELPVEVSIELPVETLAEAPIEEPITHPVELSVEIPAECSIELPVECSMEIPTECSMEIPAECSVELPVEAPTPIIRIKKMSAHERKCKEKEKLDSKKIHVAPVLPRKKRFSLHNFFINLLIISFFISMMMSGILVFM